MLTVEQLEQSIGFLTNENFHEYYLEFRKARILELEEREARGEKIKGFMEYPSVMALQDLAEAWDEKLPMLDELVLYNAPTDKGREIIHVVTNRYPEFTNELYWNVTTGEKLWQVDIEDSGKVSYATWQDLISYMTMTISDDIEGYVADIELSDSKAAVYSFRVWLRQVIDNGPTEPFKNLFAFFRRQGRIVPCKRRTVKAGKFLKEADPKLTEGQISILASDIVDLARLYDAKCDEVKISDDCTPYIQKGVVTSCMQGKDSRFFEIYDRLPHCRIAYIESEDGFLLARAIIWDEAYTIRGTKVKIMDRIYANNTANHAALQKWAVNHGYLFRSQNGMYSDGKNAVELSLYINLDNVNIEELEYLPYMDTFRYYNKEKVLYSTWRRNGYTLDVQDGKVYGVNVKEK